MVVDQVVVIVQYKLGTGYLDSCRIVVIQKCTLGSQRRTIFC